MWYADLISTVWGALALVTPHHHIPPGSPIAQCQGSELECPQYNVTFVNEEYEIRQYVPTKWVSTSMMTGPSDDGSEMFMKLFRYISGENDQGQKIPMTAPVTFLSVPQPDDPRQINLTMSFFVPTAFQGNTPVPTESDVFLQSMPSMSFYVRAYGGFTSARMAGREFAILMGSIGDASKYVQGEYFGGGYDSPFTFWGRRNEVWLLSTEDM